MPRKRKAKFSAVIGGEEYRFLWNPKTTLLYIWKRGSRKKRSIDPAHLLDLSVGQRQLFVVNVAAPLATQALPGLASFSRASTRPQSEPSSECGNHTQDQTPGTAGTDASGDCGSGTAHTPVEAAGESQPDFSISRDEYPAPAY